MEKNLTPITPYDTINIWKELIEMKHAILGMLSHKPMSGYDIRKVFQENPFLHWAGNNNQTYKALSELAGDGLTEIETVHQEGSPSKKVCHITSNGLKELAAWAATPSDDTWIRAPFLEKLAWTGQLRRKELLSLMEDYEAQVKGRIHIERSKKGQRLFQPEEGSRDHAMWELIHQRVEQMLESELEWISEAKKLADAYEDAPEDQAALSAERGDMRMDYAIDEKNNARYLRLEPEGALIESEEDGRTLASLCVENGVRRILIPASRLSGDFLRLSTTVAGLFLQKLTNYNIKAAAVLDTSTVKGKFKNFLVEANQGRMFRAYEDAEEAVNWLIGE
jgi:DNA-binding PadR family transcriptional regulator